MTEPQNRTRTRTHVRQLTWGDRGQDQSSSHKSTASPGENVLFYSGCNE